MLMTQSRENPVRVKVLYGGEQTVTELNNALQINDFRIKISEICRFHNHQVFTMKWIDDEGDPCTITTEMELQEAFRLYFLNKDNHLSVHVFASIPEGPGQPCHGETTQMYRKNAKRMRKTFYHLNGHKFEPKRFNPTAVCSYCQDRIWGLGRQGYKCVHCRLLIHRRCRPLVTHRCGDENPLQGSASRLFPNTSSSYISDPAATAGVPSNRHSGTQLQNESSTTNGIGSANVKTPERYSQEIISPSLGAQHNKPCLEDFRLLTVIGRGSYAKVLQVEHVRTGKMYAMKSIKKTLVIDEEDIEWVQTEKHVFELATNHPFLVGLHSCFQTKSRLFFVIEFVNGGDLMYHMQRKLRLPEDHARFYSAEICLALNFLHLRGIIYRDLKLDNVLMDGEGHIKLTDYGMCKEGISDTVKAGTFCGTPNYIAPEILNGFSYSFSVDWWALGVMMFEMMAGCSPWDGVGQSEDPEKNTEEYLFFVIRTRPIRIPRSILPGARQIINAFLQKDPNVRLGCAPNSSFADICGHTFFREIDWERLYNRQVTPPYRPEVRDDQDLRNFDPAFTGETIAFSPDDKTLLDKIDQSEFEGFEYINPLLMTEELDV